MSASMQVTLDYVATRPNKDGTVRYYFKRQGQPVTRLHGELMSEPFMRAYRACLAWEAPAATEREGTFAWLCDKYMDSPAFTSKAAATQNARRRVIKTMVEEPLDPDHPKPEDTFGAQPAKALTQEDLEILRDRKANNPNAGNERIKILGQIFKFAKAKKYVPLNIVIGMERLEVEEGGHETATDENIEAYFKFHKPGTRAWLAGMILTKTGVRISDLRILGRPNIRKGLLVFKTVKTGMLCELPIDAELHAALPRDNMTFLLTDYGKAFESDKAMSQRVAKWFQQAGVEGITGHSVRKWLATKMAEKGATEFELMSWFGWRDPKEARPYVQMANRRIMAQKASDKLASL